MKKKIQKPFDAEAAKNGAKVETREGRSVRILCYDRAKAAYPIIGLVNYESVEHCFSYTIEGKVLISETSENDLVIVEEVEEAKFNVGDWVFLTDGKCYPWLITAITSNCYKLQDTQGHKTELYQTTVDTFYRLWTIKDAKPGDILTSENGYPFIYYEHDYTYSKFLKAYCGIIYGKFEISDKTELWTNDNVKPATKEERDTLFKKMEEAGYSWDADSLTLSKIQKRWRDEEATIVGYYIGQNSQTLQTICNKCPDNYNVFATEKQAKSALAMARISQIMANDERFGGVITDKDWCDNHWRYAIIRTKIGLELSLRYYGYEYLAFHTREQAELFLKENEDLVKDYYMME